VLKCWHSREVNDLDTHSSEIAIEADTLLSALPVIPLEEDIELQRSPHVDLVRRVLNNRLVDEADTANDLEDNGSS